MINAYFIVNEDGLHRKKAGEELYEGMPVSLDLNGEVIACVGNASGGTATPTKVWGLTKLDSNEYADFSIGEFAAFGSGQVTVVTRGSAEISQSVYNKIEVDANTTTSTAPVLKKIYDDTKVYVPHQPLYVDAAGMITNDATVDHTSLLGKVLLPLAAGAGPLNVEIDPMATSVAADLK